MSENPYELGARPTARSANVRGPDWKPPKRWLPWAIAAGVVGSAVLAIVLLTGGEDEPQWKKNARVFYGDPKVVGTRAWNLNHPDAGQPPDAPHVMTKAERKAFDEEMKQRGADGRARFATFVESTMRDGGAYVTVEARGAANKVLHIEWIGCSAPVLSTWADRIDPLKHNTYEFSRLECSDGYQTVSIDYQ